MAGPQRRPSPAATSIRTTSGRTAPATMPSAMSGSGASQVNGRTPSVGLGPHALSGVTSPGATEQPPTPEACAATSRTAGCSARR